MIYLNNLDKNLKVGFDFLVNLPENFDVTQSEFEKYVPFILNISTPERAIVIDVDIQAYMTIYEIKKIFNGLKHLLDCACHDIDGKFRHYSSESFFEIIVEYLSEDECFNVELWFIIAKSLKEEIVGYDAGFRFTTEKTEMERFIEDLRTRFKEICSQCSKLLEI